MTFRDLTAPAAAPSRADADSVCDIAVQRLFSLGLSLQSAVWRHPDLADALTPAIAQTEALIEELRSIAFEQGRRPA